MSPQVGHRSTRGVSELTVFHRSSQELNALVPGSKEGTVRRRGFALVGLIVLAASGCAAGPNPLTNSQGSGGNAGFWMGLWHGLICPIALVVSWFNSGVSMYEVHNNGGWYNTGFVLGAGAWGVLRGSAGHKRERAA
jgi:hypothetical protein